MSVFGLRCSVNECRIDFLCREDEQIVSVRAKISLPMKQCLLAEDALLAISSACLAKNNDLYHTLKLRSDCCRLSQALSLFGENCIYDDLKWSAFSAALHGFIEILIERSPFQSSIEQVAISLNTSKIMWSWVRMEMVVMGWMDRVRHNRSRTLSSRKYSAVRFVFQISLVVKPASIAVSNLRWKPEKDERNDQEEVSQRR